MENPPIAPSQTHSVKLATRAGVIMQSSGTASARGGFESHVTERHESANLSEVGVPQHAMELSPTGERDYGTESPGRHGRNEEPGNSRLVVRADSTLDESDSEDDQYTVNYNFPLTFSLARPHGCSTTLPPDYDAPYGVENKSAFETVLRLAGEPINWNLERKLFEHLVAIENDEVVAEFRSYHTGCLHDYFFDENSDLYGHFTMSGVSDDHDECRTGVQIYAFELGANRQFLPRDWGRPHKALFFDIISEAVMDKCVPEARCLSVAKMFDGHKKIRYDVIARLYAQSKRGYFDICKVRCNVLIEDGVIILTWAICPRLLQDADQPGFIGNWVRWYMETSQMPLFTEQLGPFGAVALESIRGSRLIVNADSPETPGVIIKKLEARRISPNVGYFEPVTVFDESLARAAFGDPDAAFDIPGRIYPVWSDKAGEIVPESKRPQHSTNTIAIGDSVVAPLGGDEQP